MQPKDFMEVKLYGETPEQIKSNYEYLRNNGYSISKKCLIDESVFLKANCLFGSEDGNILRGGNMDDYCTYEQFLEEDGQEIDLHGFSEVVEDAPVVSDGGSSSYYKLTIVNKEGEQLECELGDILRVIVGNDFDLSNIVKACRRAYEASQGRGKDGVSIAYDMNKVKYFADEFKHWHTLEDNK